MQGITHRAPASNSGKIMHTASPTSKPVSLFAVPSGLPSTFPAKYISRQADLTSSYSHGDGYRLDGLEISFRNNP
jgi:hypothetical protein